MDAHKVLQLVREGVNLREFGNVDVQTQGDLMLLNYSRQAMFNNVWTPLEQVCRGLILNPSQNEVLAWPLKKFFNWGQTYGDNEVAFPKQGAKLTHVFEKMDGSLGILYRDNGYKVATRGSFNSDQAVWATQFLNNNFDLTGLSDSLTLIFEIIYPENRIVVDYGQREDLVLLAVVNRKNGIELPFYPNVYQLAEEFGFNLPTVYDFNNTREVFWSAERLKGLEHEGYVLLYSDGSRFKVKGDDYLALHKLVTNLTPKRVLEALVADQYADFVVTIPDEFRSQVEDVAVQIMNERARVSNMLWSLYEQAPKDGTRKEFALWVNQNVPSHTRKFLFGFLDGREPTLAEIAATYDIVPKSL